MQSQLGLQTAPRAGQRTLDHRSRPPGGACFQWSALEALSGSRSSPPTPTKWGVHAAGNLWTGRAEVHRISHFGHVRMADAAGVRVSAPPHAGQMKNPT